MTLLPLNPPVSSPRAEHGGGPFEFSPLFRADDGVRYFGPKEGFVPRECSEVTRQRPRRICVVTSIRDVGGDDKAGVVIEIAGQRVFNKGSLHGLLDGCKDELKGLVEVCAVIVDDIPSYHRDRTNLIGSGFSYAVLPDGTGEWIVPLDYRTSDDKALSELVVSIPSTYRTLPANDPGRTAKKRLFEESIERIASAHGADMILSDHALVKFEHLHTGHYIGRVVNIHPAITYCNDPHKLRGLTPTKDAIARAQRGGHAMTGASLHFISDDLDAGSVICDSEATPVRAGITPDALRHDNYRLSKMPVLIKGLRYLTDNFEALTKAAQIQTQMALGARRRPDPETLASANLGGLAGIERREEKVGRPNV